MATKKKAKKTAPKKPKMVNLKLTPDEANKLYDFVNVAMIEADGTVKVYEGSRDVIAGSDIDDIVFRKLADLGVAGERSFSA